MYKLRNTHVLYRYVHAQHRILYLKMFLFFLYIWGDNGSRVFGVKTKCRERDGHVFLVQHLCQKLVTTDCMGTKKAWNEITTTPTFSPNQMNSNTASSFLTITHVVTRLKFAVVCRAHLNGYLFRNSCENSFLGKLCWQEYLRSRTAIFLSIYRTLVAKRINQLLIFECCVLADCDEG